MSQFTHFDEKGNAIMVDVGKKQSTHRTALASGKIQVSSKIMKKLSDRDIKKGDVLTVAQIGGIMGVKQTSNLIPLCHQIVIDNSEIYFELIYPQNCYEKHYIKAFCQVKTHGKTGVEMEALTGVSIALLTIYDMCKAVDKSMVISDIQLESKEGGQSGDYKR